MEWTRKGTTEDNHSGGNEREATRSKREKRKRENHVRSLSVDVEHVVLLYAELEEAARDLRHGDLEFDIGDVLVVGQVEVLPRLGLLDLLTANNLRDLLLLLDDVNNVAVSECLALAVGAAGVEKHIVDGVYALDGSRNEPVVCLLEAADAGFALLCGWTNLDGALSPGLVGTEIICIAHVVKLGRSLGVGGQRVGGALDDITPPTHFRQRLLTGNAG